MFGPWPPPKKTFRKSFKSTMLFYALMSIFKTQFNKKAPGKRKVTFERQSVRAFSIASTSSRLRKQTWIEPKYTFSIEILENIMQYLDVVDASTLLRLCQVWSGNAAEAFYQSPVINGNQFPKLMKLLLESKSGTTTHPYALLVREFIFKGIAADELLMGDLKECLVICTNLASLRIEGCTQLSSLLCGYLEEHAPFLSRVEFPGCSISDSFLIKLIRGVR